MKLKTTILTKISLLVFVVTSSFAFAQSGSVTGTITDTNGIPLPGVNVLIQNTTKGSVTDFDGNYTIGDVENGTYTIEVSYVGFKTQEIALTVDGSDVELNATLKEDLMS